ncbi:hypothetical protein BD770DRAFT_408585 [Pilaira anomala]|nr:hypothetical protein BD770DRAFT_408585 [Pilaira anomala]
MNEPFKVLTIHYTNAEKEAIFFFLLQVCFLALVCYDLELDCCLKKLFHDCKVCSKKRVQTFVSRMLGLPTIEEMEVCLAQKSKLEVKVVKSEKYLWEVKDAFVKTQNEIATMKADLSKSVTKVEGLYEKIEDRKDEKQALFRSVWNKQSFYFVKEEEAKKENELLEQELLALKLLEAQNMSFV